MSNYDLKGLGMMFAIVSGTVILCSAVSIIVTWRTKK